MKGIDIALAFDRVAPVYAMPGSSIIEPSARGIRLFWISADHAVRLKSVRASASGERMPC